MISKETSAYVAKMAARGLKNPAGMSQKAIKAVCASALAQAGEDVVPTWDKLNDVKRRRLEEALGEFVFGEGASIRYARIRKILLA